MRNYLNLSDVVVDDGMNCYPNSEVDEEYNGDIQVTVQQIVENNIEQRHTNDAYRDVSFTHACM